MSLLGYLTFSALMFGIAILGMLLNRKNLLLLLICLELMLLAVSSNFIVYAKLWNDIHGQVIVLFILLISAVELAVALAILVRLFKLYGVTSVRAIISLSDNNLEQVE